MAGKTYVVLGLGTFGQSVALSLAKNGFEVIGVDKDEDKVTDIADEITYAFVGDAADKDIFQEKGLNNADGAIVTIGGSLETSILATLLAKEVGIPYVLAKAANERHADVLRKVGADRTVIPEKEMGSSIARNLAFGNFMDTFELSDNCSMVEMEVKENWAGKSLAELDVRKKHGINVVAIRQGDSIQTNLDPNEKMQLGWILLVVGYNKDLSKLK